MKYKILTVIYHENEQMFKLALQSWKSFPEGVEIVAPTNRLATGQKYPDNITYIPMDKNNLSKAWNTGLRYIFNDCDVAVVSGLDSTAPTGKGIDKLVMKASEIGFVSAVADTAPDQATKEVKHGDGSFSFFAISKECYNDVGLFNERFSPAYFEDNNYLERLWQKGYNPERLVDVQYSHLFQGSIKMGSEIRRRYPEFMQKNLELFKSIHGKVPDHLPEDINFLHLDR